MFHPQVSTVVIVSSRSKRSIVEEKSRICFYKRLGIGKTVIISVAVIKKIAAAHIHFAAPFIRIIDTECMGFGDAVLLSHHEITLASAKITGTTTTTAATASAKITATASTSTAGKSHQIL